MFARIAVRIPDSEVAEILSACGVRDAITIRALGWRRSPPTTDPTSAVNYDCVEL